MLFILTSLGLSFLAVQALGAACPGFPDVQCVEPNRCRKAAKDWQLQPLPISGYVQFTINVPQFRRQRTKEVVIGLFNDVVPTAAYNFAQFASGGIRVGKGRKAKTYQYKNTPFHRIKKDLSITGGDVQFKNGSGSITVYNASVAVLPDNFHISNYGKGWVGMVENGASYNHSIGCQFFISLTNDRRTLAGLNKQPILHLGKVVKGFQLLDRINQKAGASWGNGKIRLDNSVDPVLKVKRLRPRDGDITISESKFFTLEQGTKKGWPKYTFNRPAFGCLTGRWP